MSEVEAAANAVLEGWSQLGVMEHDGALHLPATLKRRNGDGGLTEVPVAFRMLRNPHRIQARVRSRAWFAKFPELKAYAPDGVSRGPDYDLLDEMENYEILAFAIRDASPPFDQHVTNGEELFERYDNQSLAEAWGAYDAWVRMQHPGFGKFTGEELWRVIARVAKGADLTPLAAMPGVEQATLMLLMAREACCSPNAPSWLRSSASLTPEP